MDERMQSVSPGDIAVVGVGCRFPGASDCDSFWKNLEEGKESIRFFTDDELESAGISRSSIHDKNYVKAASIIEDSDKFDYSFFKISKREAQLLDPQHRILLQCAWETLENAGYGNKQNRPVTGVFAGCSLNRYSKTIWSNNPNLIENSSPLSQLISEDKDFAATRISYLLNLTGPAMTVQSGCSTSLVAVKLAVMHLQNFECDMALAGGATIRIPQISGYFYREGEIFSPDGHCRPFDSESNGTVFGEGAGLVLLKRLEDAIEDNDSILSIIKSIAINNDGNRKVGYTAPSVEGQIDVISTALALAAISPETISMIEAHGTATKLGDPIEVSALSKVFNGASDKINFCALGSVKSNIGHLDSAAGIAGLIKVILSLKNKKIPASLHIRTPNPELMIEQSPFYIPDKTVDWRTPVFQNGQPIPRRGGVSSFGVGGTNVHAILQEFQDEPNHSADNKYYPVLLSAKSTEALTKIRHNLSQFISKNANINIGDMSYTLFSGREHFEYRWSSGSRTIEELTAKLLKKQDTYDKLSDDIKNLPVVFMFSGQGNQYVNMGKVLYNQEDFFRENLSHCAEILFKFNGIDIKKFFDDDNKENSELHELISQTIYTQPCLYIFEYCLALLMMRWGIQPSLLIGHSIGEYVAATIAGIFNPEDAIRLVAIRAEIMQRQPKGSMIAVAASESVVRDILSNNNDPVIALVNSPSSCVVSGTDEGMSQTKVLFENSNISFTALRTSHAFHSPMMNAAADEFRSKVEQFMLSKPKIPILSNVYGRIMKDEEAVNPQYWSDHICKAVKFSDSLTESLKERKIYVEIGPGNSLCSMLRSHFSGNSDDIVLNTIPPQRIAENSQGLFYDTIGKLWNLGLNIDWDNIFKKSKHKRIPLPVYPFERTRCWIDPNEDESNKYTLNETALTVNTKKEESSSYISLQSIIDIWKEFLGTDVINSNDDFFALGGHSLLAAQVLNSISKRFKITIQPSSIFTSPTPEKLMQRIQELMNKGEVKKPNISVNSFNTKTEFSLSPVQKRLWFITQLEPDSSAYNLLNTTRIQGDIDKDIFITAINKISERHDTLRSIFHSKDGEPFTIIKREFTPEVFFEDYSNRQYEDVQSIIENKLQVLVKKPFDLKEGPLWRVRVFKTGDKQAIIALIIHHIISDGWSFNLFIGELNDVYYKLSLDNNYNHPPLEHSYLEYAEAENQRIEKASFVDHEKYWKENLSGTLPILALPLAKLRPQVPEYKGSIAKVSFPVNFREDLQRIVKSSGASLFSGIISIFSLLLHKYGGGDKIIIGTPYSGRDQTEWEKVIGFFINMLPIKFEINPDISIRDFLLEHGQKIKETLSHYQYPFNSLVELIKPPREMNVSPIFQVMCVYQNLQQFDKKRKSDLTFEPFYMDRGISEYDMSFYIWDNGTEFQGILEYNFALFDKAIIENMLVHFNQLMSIVVISPDIKISSIPMITTEEIDIQISSCKKSITGIENYSGLIHLIKQKVKEKPEAVSCICDKKHLSYYQLWNLSENIASQLLINGAGKGKIVGLCIERSVEMVAALLAIIKTGSSYLPLDPAFPSLRLRQIIEESKTELIITDVHTKQLFSDYQKQIFLDINNLSKCKNSSATDSEIHWPTHTDTAYVLFTSGSTGKPKGVEISHGSLLNFLMSMKKIPGLKPEDVLLAVTTVSFDISGLEIWLPLICGATVRIVSREKASDGYELLNEIHKGNVTVMQATPSTWKMLLDAGWERAIGFKALCGGEAYSRDLANRILQTGARLWNMYGPTETTIWSSIAEITLSDEPVSLGEPIDNTWFLIIDKNGLPLPNGIPGELCIGGLGLAKGYLNQPELTNSKFRDPPAGFESLGRMYHTGDLAFKHIDGHLIFMGRTDHQVKIRGYRIELQEIESQIRKNPIIKDCIVWTPEDPNGEKRLVAYIITSNKTGKKDISSEVRNDLRKLLPPYMIPEYFVVLDKFPMTSNGKIDRKGLSFPNYCKEAPDRKFLFPKNTNEQIILEIWRKVLGISNISIDDDYFDIGGNSIQATRLLANIEKSFNIRLPLAMLYEAPTIQLQAKLISRKSHSMDWNVLVPLRSSGRKPPLFLIHGAGGNILLYRDLVKYLDENQPVYGIQSIGLDGTSKPLTSIEEMGRTYAKEIISVYPEGPYLLGGYCMGGLIAYETAINLLNSNREIGMVALLDTAAFWTDLKYHEKLLFLYQNANFHLKNIINADNAGKYAFFRDRTVEAFRRFRINANTLANRIAGRSEKSTYLIFNEIKNINDNAARNYKPNPYSGKVTLFRPLKNFSNIDSNTMGWDKIQTGGLDIISLSAYPKGILVKPYVRELALKMNEYVDKALSSFQSDKYINETMENVPG